MPVFATFRRLRQESKEAKLKSKTHPASNPSQKKHYRPFSSIDPQLHSPLFTRLPLEIRITIYKLLFGDRSLHYHCEWESEKQEWRIYSYGCYSHVERLDLDHCPGSLSHAPDSAKYWGLWIDIGILSSCWKTYIEGLPVLYGSNEFRLSKQRDLCSTLPAQIPILGLSSIRRLTFWWELDPSIQPHVSRKNGKDYNAVWSILSQKYTSLTHIRIFVDCVGLAEFTLPELFGEGDEAKQRYIQGEWLDGMEKMIEGNENLQVFEVHFDSAVYRVLRSRVKNWLKEMARQRRIKNKNNDVRYESFKCGHTAITWQGCPDGKYDRPYSRGGSSDISIRDPRSYPDSYWWKKIQDRQKNNGA